MKVTTISPLLVLCDLYALAKVVVVVVVSLEDVYWRAEVTGLGTLYHRGWLGQGQGLAAQRRGGIGDAWMIRVERITKTRLCDS